MPVSVFKYAQAAQVTLSGIYGTQTNRLLVVTTWMERARGCALGVVNDMLRVEVGRLAGLGVFGF